GPSGWRSAASPQRSDRDASTSSSVGSGELVEAAGGWACKLPNIAPSAMARNTHAGNAVPGVECFVRSDITLALVFRERAPEFAAVGIPQQSGNSTPLGNGAYWTFPPGGARPVPPLPGGRGLG